MKTLKFRDFDLEAKIMNFYDLDGYDRYNHDCYGNIMLFTGLKDIKGIEIFEGDVIKYNGENYTVRYYDAMFNCVKINNDLVDIPLWEAASKGIIVGNIHENTELLQTV